MSKISEVGKDTTLAEILENPEADPIRKKFSNGAKKILAKYNLPCLDCPFAKAEMSTLTLGIVCRIYGIDLEGLLKELNERLKKLSN